MRAWLLLATILVAVPGATRSLAAEPARSATTVSAGWAFGGPVLPPGEHRRGEVSEREKRAQRFAARQDSLIQSRNYEFLPVNMQGNGGMQLVYNYYYYVGVTPQGVEVHMPWIAGRGTDLVEPLNFDTPNVQNYRAERQPDGWSVVFRAVPEGSPAYVFNMNVNTATGHVVLTIQTAANTIQYMGSIEKNEPLEQNAPPTDFL